MLLARANGRAEAIPSNSAVATARRSLISPSSLYCKGDVKSPSSLTAAIERESPVYQVVAHDRFSASDSREHDLAMSPVAATHHLAAT